MPLGRVLTKRPNRGFWSSSLTLTRRMSSHLSVLVIGPARVTGKQRRLFRPHVAEVSPQVSQHRSEAGACEADAVAREGGHPVALPTAEIKSMLARGPHATSSTGWSSSSLQPGHERKRGAWRGRTSSSSKQQTWRASCRRRRECWGVRRAKGRSCKGQGGNSQTALTSQRRRNLE